MADALNLDTVDALQVRIEELERENARLRAGVFTPSSPQVVRAPLEVQPIFDRATEALRSYFQRLHIDPAKAMIGVDDERYVLVRASAFSMDFLDTVVQLYADRGEREAMAIGRGFLFDIAHTIGLNDARRLHAKFGSCDPLERLSGGPVHFAYTGWGLVDIRPESRPTPDDEYCLVYEHTYSFEASSFLRAGRTSDGPICSLQAGYSSGWCEASFGLELTAVEVECRARGDAACMFVMAPPHRVAERVREHFNVDLGVLREKGFDVPTYFERKRAEEELRASLKKLKETQEELIRKERLATVGLLVSGVAHEVNTPLGVAVTALSVVTDELRTLGERFENSSLTKKELRHFLTRATQASAMVSANLERAATQVTNFKRVSIDQVTEEHREVDVGEQIRQTVASLKPVIRQGGLQVALSTEGDLVTQTHPGAITQIITNFVTNSIAHGRPRDQSGVVKVTIGTRRTSRGTVLVTYADDGQGMTPEVRAQAFQPFFTTARGGGGTGLGLHIVHSLVNDVLRGTIKLHTEAGSGVRFEIEIGTPG
ncbi:MAG: hypothetical protein HOW73_27005 [Polyangiaceae bacterium]|nr:hypothetical protein [Polyangiaceae bacterium]